MSHHKKIATRIPIVILTALFLLLTTSSVAPVLTRAGMANSKESKANFVNASLSTRSYFPDTPDDPLLNYTFHYYHYDPNNYPDPNDEGVQKWRESSLYSETREWAYMPNGEFKLFSYRNGQCTNWHVYDWRYADGAMWFMRLHDIQRRYNPQAGIGKYFTYNEDGSLGRIVAREFMASHQEYQRGAIEGHFSQKVNPWPNCMPHPAGGTKEGRQFYTKLTPGSRVWTPILLGLCRVNQQGSCDAPCPCVDNIWNSGKDYEECMHSLMIQEKGRTPGQGPTFTTYVEHYFFNHPLVAGCNDIEMLTYTWQYEPTWGKQNIDIAMLYMVCNKQSGYCVDLWVDP
jgi:hypothetical protein